MSRLPRIPGNPPEAQSPMVAEAQEPDGSWRLIAGPGLGRDVMAAARQYRADQGHLAPETRVRLAEGEQLAHWRGGQ